MVASHDKTAFGTEKRIALWSLTVGIVLTGVKFGAYALTGSAAVFSDALESIVNVLASGFALYAVILAHQPADEKHPYGHGKVEFMSAGFEGGLILLAAIVIIWRAIEQVLHGLEPTRIDAGLILVLAAMIINGIMGGLLVRHGKRNGSVTLEADGWHLLSDAITSAAVLGALFLIRFTGKTWIDPLTAILVALYIMFVATQLLRRSSAGLMDEQDEADHVVISSILDSHIGPAGKAPHICSYHKLRHRHSGRYHWIDFHIMVPATLTIDEGHRIASIIEYEIECALGEGNATAHVEPCEDEECCKAPIATMA